MRRHTRHATHGKEISERSREKARENRFQGKNVRNLTLEGFHYMPDHGMTQNSVKRVPLDTDLTQNAFDTPCSVSNHALVGSFCSSRKTSARTSRTAMERTPSEASPVTVVVVATRKLPRIDALLPKIS